MSRLLRCFFIILLFGNPVHAQTNITRLWIDSDPVKGSSTISAKEAIKTHEAFLKRAVAENNTAAAFFGNVYLYKDYMEEEEYQIAASFLLDAEKIADKKNNTAWKAFLKVRRGWVTFIVKNDAKKAINEYLIGANLAKQAGDSLTMALCYEQISTMYNSLKSYDSSHYYFNLAIPVLRNSTEISLEAVYSNYSGLMLNEGKTAEALLYNDSAFQIVHQRKAVRNENFFLINRAVILNKLDRYDSAEIVLRQTLRSDSTNRWMVNLQYDYEGLSETYHLKGNNAAAFDNLIKYHELKDSLSGIAVNLKVAGAEEQYKKNIDALAAKAALQNRNLIIAAAIVLLITTLLFWRSRHISAKKELMKNRAGLNVLTQILIEKNAQLLALQEEFDEAKKETEKTSPPEKNSANEGGPDFENDLYNQRILRAEDWTAFRTYFEKAFPGYIRRLRQTHKDLSAAEERLFLFIKLDLKTKESADILGISMDSVKKSRNRLRKRLMLDESVDLDDYVKTF